MRILLYFCLSFPLFLTAQQRETYDYFKANEDMIAAGVQAILMCNGLFTSERTLPQVFNQELKYLARPIGSARGGDYQVDYARKSVAIGSPGGVPVMRAVFRTGIGCIILAPDQDFSVVSTLPELPEPTPSENPIDAVWPDGDRVPELKWPTEVDELRLQAASDWAFNRPTPEQVTLSLLIVHRGQIIHERYAEGVDVYTKTRTWSTAKSIAATLIGMLVDNGRLELDAPLAVDWLPKTTTDAPDPRDLITLRHVLHMSSGLYNVDSHVRGAEYATGSGLAYWAGASSVQGALNRGLIRRPGTFWEYENYDTLLGVLAMKNALGSTAAYHQFPRAALFDKISMHNTLVSTDRFGDFIFSSQVYTNARDLARFGLLYLNRGLWRGERLLSEDWIEFVRTPAPATTERGNFYGAQWWLVPDDRTDVPKDAYSTAGNRGQFVIVVPSHDLVIVRRGLDYGRQGFDRWDLLREVLRAF